MPKTNFTPLKHGFHFSNTFSNKIINTKYGSIETKGRCGGMAFASLDYYFSNTPLPKNESMDFSNGVPQDGSFLGDYIYKRLIDSFFTATSYKFVDWTLAPDSKRCFRKGVSHWTKREEFPKLRKEIDEGRPMVLGLIRARDIRNIGRNHQVVAYGYEHNPINDKITIYIYDNNSPDEEVLLTSDQSSLHFSASNRKIWRGFFIQEYKHKSPESTGMTTF